MLGWDPGAVVGDGNEEVGLGGAGADLDAAVIARDGLVGVADEVVKNLLELVGIDESGGHFFREVEIHSDVAGGDFRLK